MSAPQSSALSPKDALHALATHLRGEDSVISAYVVDPVDEPALGLLVAAGPRAAAAPGEYALVFEAVREGYLLHYGTSRLLNGHDADLALLAGDYLYASGIERLAGLQNLEAVRELSDLISLSAQLHAEGDGDPAGTEALSAALWLAVATAVGAGPGPETEGAKAGLREGSPDAARVLNQAASEAAARVGMGAQLSAAAEAIGFAAP